MKRRIALFVGAVAAISLGWVGVLNAANVRSGQSPTVMSNETINGTLYSAGNVVKVDGRVEGDLMCAGETVTITGTIEGDVLCLAQQITISGHVEGSVRVLAQTVALNGKIDGSVSVGAMVTTISKDAVIARDVTLAVQQATVDGTIARDVTAIAGQFSSSGMVGRDLDVTGETVTLTPTADVAGDFRYVSDSDASVAEGAKIAGKTDHRVPEQKATQNTGLQAYFAPAFFGLASFTLLGAAVLVGSPRAVNAVTRAVKRSPFGTLGAGLIGLICPPLLAIVLLVTVAGIPLGVVLLLSWIISLLLGLVLSASTLGQLLMAKMGWQEPWGKFASLMLGLLVLFIASLLPYVGGFIMFGAVVWGVGGICYAIMAQRGGIPTSNVKVGGK